MSKPAHPLPLVAVVGRANVGKSTLFNRLLREGRSLVEGSPGVTRDRVAAATSIEGRDVLLVDTGGLDPDAEAGIPAAIRQQVREVLEGAAVILLVVDARKGLLPLDAQIADLLRKAKTPVILVANKADSPAQDAASAEFHALGFPEVLPVSAEHRRGLADLELAIASRLPEPSVEETPADASPRLAIVGRPNAGKSSLLNRLLGAERNIVAPEPGTTRDATDSRVRFGRQEVVLIDTAGLRRLGKRREHLERGSALMAVRSIERADLAVLVLDASVGVTDQDSKIARLALDRGRGLILALNKWDLVQGTREERQVERQLERKLGFVRDPVVLRTSAKTGQGVGKLVALALELVRELRLEIPTAEVNRALEEAVERNAPPMRGRRRARFFYATQTSSRPLTLLVFVNDPDLIPANYRKYVESFFRTRFGVRSAPVRVRFRARREDGRR